EVGAGAERAGAGPGQDAGADLPVLVQSAPRLFQRSVMGAVNGIHRRGPINGDSRDVTVGLIVDGHGLTLRRSVEVREHARRYRRKSSWSKSARFDRGAFHETCARR